MSKPTRPPADLIAAFKSAEKPNSIAVLLLDDGFDAISMRVLAAWQHTRLSWEKPPSKCPDDVPTPRAWAWICRGLEIDFVGLAEAADVVVPVAREKARMLLGARLVYPDGTYARAAETALNEHVRARLFPNAKPEKEKAPKKKRAEPDSPDDMN